MPWSNKGQASSTARGYGKDHRKLRKQWEQLVNAGGVRCWRPDCRRPIAPYSKWHLGHSDWDRSVYMGPECIPCNLKAAGRKGHLMQKISKPRTTTDRW